MCSGFVAYLVFVLACLVPGWVLRERIAAEFQMNSSGRPLPMGPPRFLGPSGVEHLCEVLVKDGDLARRSRAAQMLYAYDGLAVVRAGLLVSSDPDINIALFPTRLIRLWRPQTMATCIDDMSGEEFARMMACPSDWLVWDLWVLRPERCEWWYSRVLRETDDLKRAARIASASSTRFQRVIRTPGGPRFENPPFPGDAWDARMRALKSGMQNSNAEIRNLCADLLAKEEAKHGGR